jgi:hypothetical protein
LTAGIAHDGTFVYLVGTTRSADFPVVLPAQSTYAGDSDPAGAGDIFVLKRDAATRATVWATYLGGSETDFGNGIVLDTQGNVIISGWTRSSDFPVTPDGLQTNLAGLSDGIIAKFNPTGALVYASYYGGTNDDQFAAIAIQGGSIPDNTLALTGFSNSPDYPTTSIGLEDITCGCSGGATDVVVLRLNADMTVRWSTFLGRSASEIGMAVDLTSQGHAVVSGWTESADFYKSMFQTHQEGRDAFITELDVFDARRRKSGIIGGSGDDSGQGVVYLSDVNYYIAGTSASAD